MSQEPIWRDYENKSDAEKILSRLKQIDENLDGLYCKVHNIDEKFLHSESMNVLRKLHDVLVGVRGCIVLFGVMIVILLYRISNT